jgi:hypothetical protein
MERLVIVAEDKDLQWGRSLLLRAGEIARQIDAQNIASLIGERALHQAETNAEHPMPELVLWGRAGRQFLAAWTSVSPDSEVVAVAQCQSEGGLVAEVFAAGSSRFQQEPLLQAPSFTNLGDRRGTPVRSMRGLPISVFGQCIGVLTWVEYDTPSGPASEEDRDVSRWAMAFGRFSELKILKMCLGMDAEP